MTKHASQRMMERFPQLVRDDQHAIDFIYRAVQSALHAGRRSVRKPSWIVFVERGRGYNPRDRFVWDAHESMCFVLYEMKRSEIRNERSFKTSYMVRTVMAREEDRDAAHLARADAQFRDGLARSGRYSQKDRRGAPL